MGFLQLISKNKLANAKKSDGKAEGAVKFEMVDCGTLEQAHCYVLVNIEEVETYAQ